MDILLNEGCVNCYKSKREGEKEPDRERDTETDRQRAKVQSAPLGLVLSWSCHIVALLPRMQG